MKNKEKKVHPVSIKGFDGDLRKLAFLVVGLRFDVMAEFFGYIGEVMREMAAKDHERGKPVLARMLNLAAGQADNVKWFLNIIFNRFRKHMEHELSLEK